MKKKDLIISIFLHGLLLITAYVFQGVVFPYMRINGLVPLLLPIASTGIALYEGQYTGGIAGLFAGILCDISFNQPIGIFTVFLTLSGLIIGALSDSVVLRGFVTYYISCAVILVAAVIVQILQLVILPAYSIPTYLMIPIAIQQTIYSLILAFPIWFFVRAISTHTDKILPSGRTR